MSVPRDWLDGFHEISKAINASLELWEIFEVIGRETQRLIQFDRLSMGLLEEGGERLRLHVPVAHPETVRPSGSVIPLDGHVFGEVVRKREPLAIADLRADERFPGERVLAEEGVVSIVALPLVFGQRVLGALAFARREPHPFTEAETALLRAVAEQAAIAVEHAKVFAAERKRANHLAIINQVARRALGILDLDTLIQQTAALLQQHFAYYDVSIFLVDRAAGEVVLRAQAGAYTGESAIGYRQRIGAGIVGIVAQTGRTLLINDVTKDPRYLLAFEGERASRSELAVPIRFEDRVVGVINIECQEVGALDSIDVTAIETLSGQLAQAMQNAFFYEDMLREKQKLDDVVSAMGAGLVLIDPDLTIVWSNKTINEWFNDGRSLVGQKCHAVHLDPATPCPGCKAAATFLDGQMHTDIQVRATSRMGTRCFQNTFAAVRDRTGKVVQIIMLAFDVTEHTANVERITVLQKLSQMMQGVVDLDRLLHMVLACVTAGPGLGFNRAILLLTNEEGTLLEGKLGVGPASAEEAGRIWRELAARARTLDDLMALMDESRSAPTDSALQYLARQIAIPMSEVAEPPVRALVERRVVVVPSPSDPPGVGSRLRSLLGAREFVCVPLIAHDVALGAIIADNVFSGHPIGGREVAMLQTFASQAGLAIAAARAYTRLEEKVRELQETRDRLVRSERLAVVGRLAAHVAHEIRNPLATIGGFSRSILKSLDDPRRVARNARIILEEVERLEQILANVMNFTKPGMPVFRDRDPNEAVESLCAFHENVLAERKIVLRKELDPACPLLRFDPDQMRQVLLNLFQNAIDSMPEGGELTVTTRVVRPAHDALGEPKGAAEGRVEIIVSDTGHGMTENVMENIFQPFFTTKVGGTGLGLAVCQRIVHDHGGDIVVSSRPGAGSSFTISLPIPS